MEARRKEGRTFNVGAELRLGCVMSPWMFNLLMDGVIGEWNARIMNACS